MKLKIKDIKIGTRLELVEEELRKATKPFVLGWLDYMRSQEEIIVTDLDGDVLEINNSDDWGISDESIKYFKKAEDKMLKIENLKIGDELECISCEAFVNDQVADKRVLNLKKIIVSGFFSTYVCVNDSGIANDHKLIIGNFRLKHFRKKPKLKFSDLEVGDYVYVRDDLVEFKDYGCTYYVDEIGSGIQQIESFHSEDSQFITNKSHYWVTPEMIDLSRSMKKDDYLKVNEKEDVSFDDLIDAAVQAKKYGVCDSVEIDINNWLIVKSSIGNIHCHKNHLIHDNEFHINWIKSLYTEEFVIETEEDLNKIGSGRISITLANGEVLGNDHLFFLSQRKNDFVFKLLKGATVTQERCNE